MKQAKIGGVDSKLRGARRVFLVGVAARWSCDRWGLTGRQRKTIVRGIDRAVCGSSADGQSETALVSLRGGIWVCRTAAGIAWGARGSRVQISALRPA